MAEILSDNWHLYPPRPPSRPSSNGWRVNKSVFMTIGFTVTWPKESRGIELGRGIKGIFISGAEITDTKTGLVQNFSYTFVSHFSVSHNENL